MADLTQGGWIKARRYAIGLTLAEAGHRAGLSSSAFANIEAGRWQPSPAQWPRLAKALRCSVRDLRLADEFTPCRRCGRAGPRGGTHG